MNRILLTLVALLNAATVACPAVAATRPNLLMIVADDLRADVKSVYGGPVNTPHLEALAARGTLFHRATCGYPICHVSRSEMLSGRVLVSEAAGGRGIPFAESWTLWPQAMRDAGWRTVHLGKWHVSGTPASCGYVETAALFSGSGTTGLPLTLSKSATGRNVTGYPGWTFKADDNQPLLEFGVGITPRTDERIADAAVDVIRKGSSQPLFVHVNFTAPHDPLHWPEGKENRDRADGIALPRNFREQPPFDSGNVGGRDELIVPAPRSEDDVRRERAVYYALVENLDAQVGRLLQAIRSSADPENWIVVFTSDQGLALGSHGLMGKQNQYEHTVNAPLILAGPGIPAGRRVESSCALRDLYPTVCELTGVAIPDSVQGKSLLPPLRGESRESETIYGYFTDTQRMIRDADGWKLIWYPRIDRVQLFQTSEDPDEMHDLSNEPGQRARVAEMRGRLRAWLKEHGDRLTP